MKCKYDRDNCQFLGDKEVCAMCVDGIMGVSNYLPKEVPQNLPKADSASLLAEVREMKIDVDPDDYNPYDTVDNYNDGYNTAIDDILQKISEHFS